MQSLFVFVFVLACAPAADPDDTGAHEEDDTGLTPAMPTIHVEGTIGGAAYTFDCGAEATLMTYSTFPDGAAWFANLSCDGADGDDRVDVVATDAEVGRVYGAEDAASFNAFRVVVDDGAAQFDYMDPSAYALTFTTASAESGVGVTLAGTFSGTWADAELSGAFDGFAPCASGCAE